CSSPTPGSRPSTTPRSTRLRSPVGVVAAGRGLRLSTTARI
ncbi:MAG: hypothetical protein AVDCRST_MAG88-3612, partial [uncultured Thermomicrobiales bacterium]